MKPSPRHDLEIPDHRVARSTFSAEGGQAACGELLDSGVTAIVCASDPLALGAIRAVRRRGLAVPSDVSVVGFDDSAFMKYTDRRSTTVRQPIESMGRAAVDRLVSQLEGRRDGPASCSSPRTRRPVIDRERPLAPSLAFRNQSLHSA